jgi:hypothetical protein
MSSLTNDLLQLIWHLNLADVVWQVASMYGLKYPHCGQGKWTKTSYCLLLLFSDCSSSCCACLPLVMMHSGYGFDGSNPSSNVVVIPVPVSTSYPNGAVLCDVVAATYWKVQCR